MAEETPPAAEFVHRTFHLDYGNINYPATATYALFQLGKMFNEDKYLAKAAELADGFLARFTPDGLLWGEGGQQATSRDRIRSTWATTWKRAFRRWPSTASYLDHEALLEKVATSLQIHLEFMLPNGGWDNSWGTRNFKWTLWGSRTSDGCHPGYYLCADKHPYFAEAVYRNLKCLEASTHENILTSGPHEHLAGVSPSIHHTFEHAKALTKLLHTAPPVTGKQEELLPREKEYGIKKYDSINTVLFSKGPWRGTVTGYNYLYKEKQHDGHCSGGALSCLYHMDVGIVSVASMTEYQRWESQNMLSQEHVKHFICLTPRLELGLPGGQLYRNISDHQAQIRIVETDEELRIRAKAKLVTGEQIEPELGSPQVAITYRITRNAFEIFLRLDQAVEKGSLTYFFPVVCSSEDKVTVKSNRLTVRNSCGILSVESNHVIQTPIPADQRGYNFVPGLQAFPIHLDCSNLHQKNYVLTFLAKRSI